LGRAIYLHPDGGTVLRDNAVGQIERGPFEFRGRECLFMHLIGAILDQEGAVFAHVGERCKALAFGSGG
jgi:hypothetical protein